MSEIDLAFRRIQRGDRAAFVDWIRRVEMPLRASLRRFARFVDVEDVVQEGLLRMWVLAPRVVLDGRNASLRYALTLVRNLARKEVRRRHGHVVFDPEEHADPVGPDPPPDPRLKQAILDCLSRLPARLRSALMARIEGGGRLHDRLLAERLHMKPNTFLQCIVRARRRLADCLKRRHGVSLAEVMR